MDLKQPLLRSSEVGFLAKSVRQCVGVIANQLCSLAVNLNATAFQFIPSKIHNFPFDSRTKLKGSYCDNFCNGITFTATSLRAAIFGLKFVAIGHNRAISALHSGLKFVKIARYCKN